MRPVHPLVGYTAFGALLKALRKRAGLSQEELGRAVNYTREYISLLESGRRKPDPTAIAGLFVPALDLLDAPSTARQLIELAAQARGKQPTDFGIALAHEQVAQSQNGDIHSQTLVDASSAQAGHLPGILNWYVTIDPEAALDLANAMGPYWRANGQFTQARAWLRSILAHSTSNRIGRGQALLHAAEFARHQGDLLEALDLFEQAQQVFESNADTKGQCAALIERGWALFDTNRRRNEAIAAFEQCLDLARRQQHAEGTVDALGALAHVRMAEASQRGQFDSVQSLLDEALDWLRRCDNTRKSGFIYSQYAVFMLHKGSPAAAKPMFEQAMSAFQQTGDQYSLAWTYDGLGECYFEQGRLNEALVCHESALAIFRASAGREGIVTSLHHIARIKAHQGHAAAATALFVECLEMCEAHGHPQMRARCIAGLGYVALITAHETTGVQLFAAADRLMAQFPPFLYPAQKSQYAAYANRAHAQLGDLAFNQAWMHGSALVDDAVTALSIALAANFVPSMAESAQRSAHHAD